MCALVFGPLGLPLGIVALVKLRNRPGQQGRGLAIAAIVLGIIGTLAIVIVIMVSAFSPEKLDSADAERKLEAQLTTQLGQRVTVDCPEDIPLGIGKITNCTLRTATGEERVLRLTQDDAEGNFTFRVTGQSP